MVEYCYGQTFTNRISERDLSCDGTWKWSSRGRDRHKGHRHKGHPSNDRHFDAIGPPQARQFRKAPSLMALTHAGEHSSVQINTS